MINYRKIVGEDTLKMGFAAEGLLDLVYKRLELNFEGKIDSFMLNSGLHKADPYLHRKWNVFINRLNGVSDLKIGYPCLDSTCELGKECPLNTRVSYFF